MEYVRCVCVWLGAAWLERWVDWMRGLDFTNPVGTGGMLDVCLYLCFGCGGVGGEWVGALDLGLKGWVVLCLCEL